MKITYSDRNKLIVEERPILFAVILAGFILVFAGAGVVALFQGEVLVALLCAGGVAFIWLFVHVFVRRVQVIFDRENGLIDIRRKSLRRQTRRTLPLAVLKRAQIAESYSSDGSTYRVELVLAPGHNDGPLPLTNYYSSGEIPKRVVANAINALIDGADGSHT